MYDAEAQVWVAESDDVPGLITEADTYPELFAKLQVMIPELIELNEGSDGEAPVELITRMPQRDLCARKADFGPASRALKGSGCQLIAQARATTRSGTAQSYPKFPVDQKVKSRHTANGVRSRPACRRRSRRPSLPSSADADATVDMVVQPTNRRTNSRNSRSSICALLALVVIAARSVAARPPLVLSQLGLEGDDPLLELHDAGQEFRVQGFGRLGHLLVQAKSHSLGHGDQLGRDLLARQAGILGVGDGLAQSPANCSGVIARAPPT